MEVGFTPSFIRLFKKFEPALQLEILEKIELFKDLKNHHHLKVHKLSGKLQNHWSFSVNYQLRIVFTHPAAKPPSAILLAIGNHDLYR